jgi:flavin reductase (DIM6/NTAB) family NADH-FMN oxidoreductase RutF
MIEPSHFKRVMRQHVSSVVVIAVKAGDRIHCMTATSFTAVSLQPPLVLFCVHRDSSTHRLLALSRMVGVSLLAAPQEELSRRFASKGPERYAIDDIRFTLSPGGGLVIPDACGALEVELTARHRGGDHSIFVGKVGWADFCADRQPLLYHDGRYTSPTVVTECKIPTVKLATVG